MKMRVRMKMEFSVQIATNINLINLIRILEYVVSK